LLVLYSQRRIKAQYNAQLLALQQAQAQLDEEEQNYNGGQQNYNNTYNERDEYDQYDQHNHTHSNYSNNNHQYEEPEYNDQPQYTSYADRYEREPEEYGRGDDTDKPVSPRDGMSLAS
jgi:Tfp pilus assembly protein PilX